MLSTRSCWASARQVSTDAATPVVVPVDVDMEDPPSFTTKTLLRHDNATPGRGRVKSNRDGNPSEACLRAMPPAARMLVPNCESTPAMQRSPWFRVLIILGVIALGMYV